MGLIQPHELSLNCRPTFIPRTVSEFLGQASMIGNVKEKKFKLGEYIQRLEDEMRKIDAFKRELPLSLLLLNDAITTVKEEAMQCRDVDAEPVLEEFIPLNRSGDEDGNKDEFGKEHDNKERLDWLSSVQLWNGDHCSNLEFGNSGESSKPETITRAEVNNVAPNVPFKSCSSQSRGTAFVPFKGYTGFSLMAARKEEKEKLAGLPGLSLGTPGTKGPRDHIVSGGFTLKNNGSKIGLSSSTNGQSGLHSGAQTHQQQTTRKQRRCWSPELHRRFVEALQQLGGSQAATPKQIRELMQVDGLTNDEVKSHLQKYRLHTRKLSASSPSTANQSGLALWASQDQYRESSKQSNSHSGSPQDPLQYGGASRGTSTTGGDSMEDEDGDDKSESHSWKSHVHSSSEKRKY